MRKWECEPSRFLHLLTFLPSHFPTFPLCRSICLDALHHAATRDAGAVEAAIGPGQEVLGRKFFGGKTTVATPTLRPIGCCTLRFGSRRSGGPRVAIDRPTRPPGGIRNWAK